MKQLRADMKMAEGCDLPNTATLNSTRGRRNTVKPGKRIRISSMPRNRGWSSKIMIMLMMMTVVVVVLVVRRLSKFLLLFLALGKVFSAAGRCYLCLAFKFIAITIRYY